VLQAGRSWVHFPKLSEVSSDIMLLASLAVGLTQPIIEMSTRNISWGVIEMSTRNISWGVKAAGA